MAIKIHALDHDEVIKSVVLTGETTYGYAIEAIYPLINRFDAQRKLQSPSFYDRLRRDIVNGCIMPPITLAIVDKDLEALSSVGCAQEYVSGKIASGYVLDGMQRLNTLYSVKDWEGFNPDRKMYVTMIVSGNRDMLLYRMITLNNGQKPMSPRHQIEVLTEELFEFRSLDISVQTEKERSERIVRGSFNLSDISKGYLAFFTNSLHNDNNKIISEKMDEIIVGKIMESTPGNEIEFQAVLELIDKFSKNESAKSWLKTQNNLIGFCVGVKKSFDFTSTLDADEFGAATEKFEFAFKSINAAKVNLGKYRRELSRKYIEMLQDFSGCDEQGLIEFFAETTAS